MDDIDDGTIAARAADDTIFRQVVRESRKRELGTRRIIAPPVVELQPAFASRAKKVTREEFEKLLAETTTPFEEDGGGSSSKLAEVRRSSKKSPKKNRTNGSSTLDENVIKEMEAIGASRTKYSMKVLEKDTSAAASAVDKHKVISEQLEAVSSFLRFRIRAFTNMSQPLNKAIPNSSVYSILGSRRDEEIKGAVTAIGKNCLRMLSLLGRMQSIVVSKNSLLRSRGDWPPTDGTEEEASTTGSDAEPDPKFVRVYHRVLTQTLPKGSVYPSQILGLEPVQDRTELEVMLEKKLKVGLVLRQLHNRKQHEKYGEDVIWRTWDSKLSGLLYKYLVPSLDFVKDEQTRSGKQGLSQSGGIIRPISSQVREYLMSGALTRSIVAMSSAGVQTVCPYRLVSQLPTLLHHTSANDDIQIQVLITDSSGGASSSYMPSSIRDRKSHVASTTNVDTRASKGRKIRFKVIPELVNFLPSQPRNFEEKAMSYFSSTDSSVIESLMQSLFKQQ